MEKTIFSDVPKKNEPWDVVIVGSGPAALTAAIYTTRGAASTLVLAGSSWGGQLMLTTTVDNFPGFNDGIEGPKLMEQMRLQAERFGANILNSEATGVNIKTSPFQIDSGPKKFYARTLIVATGAETVWLGVEGEDKLRGRGVSSCAPCDAPFFKDKKVAVVGGGDAAMEEASVLTKYASKVFLIHRRNEFRASPAMQEKVLANNKIEIIWDTQIDKVLGDTKLEKVVLKTQKGGKEESLLSAIINREQGKNLEEREGFVFWEMPMDGLFVAIGHKPASEIFKEKLDLDEKGYIKRQTSSVSSSSTNVPGVFVAGDVNDHLYKQAITASGFGCMAAMDALKYLDKPAPTW